MLEVFFANYLTLGDYIYFTSVLCLIFFGFIYVIPKVLISKEEYPEVNKFVAAIMTISFLIITVFWMNCLFQY